MFDLAYPLKLAGGDLKITAPTPTDQALSVLLTIKGERPLNAEYGTQPYLFDDVIQTGLPVQLLDQGCYLVRILNQRYP